MSADLPLISIVIPVYNAEKYLERCVCSALSQTYPNLEILLVDNGSIDKSGKICDDFAKQDRRIKVIHMEKNEGPGGARNCGINASSGEYIAFMDSDDEADPDYIEYLYRLIIENKVLLSFCGFRARKKEGKIAYIKGKNNAKTEIFTSAQCLEKLLYGEDGIEVVPYCKLYHYSLFANIRYLSNKSSDDMGTTYKLIHEAKRIACGSQCKYTYWIYNSSVTHKVSTRSCVDLVEAGDNMALDSCQWYPQLRDAAVRHRVWTRFVALNWLMTTSDQYICKQKDIISFIYSYEKEVLNNSRTPKKDKVALCLLRIGYPVYKIFWKAYSFFAK